MTAEQLLSECEAVGLRFARNGDRLAVDAEPGSLTDDVKRWLAAEKAAILAAVDAAAEPQGEPVELGPDGWPVDSVEIEWACLRCGGIAAWWDLLGGAHCMSCESRALRRSHELAERAARLRRQ